MIYIPYHVWLPVLERECQNGWGTNYVPSVRFPEVRPFSSLAYDHMFNLRELSKILSISDIEVGRNVHDKYFCVLEKAYNSYFMKTQRTIYHNRNEDIKIFGSGVLNCHKGIVAEFRYELLSSKKGEKPHLCPRETTQEFIEVREIIKALKDN